MNGKAVWRKCGNCKKEVQFGQAYQACSISSCKKHVFCSVDCWDLHNSIMNHKNAWAEEEIAPMGEEERRQPRRIIVPSPSSSSDRQGQKDIPMDVLVVASKLKAYVKERHGLNTSANVMEQLSHMIRYSCDQAVDNARAEGRKTLMDRDFKNHEL